MAKKTYPKFGGGEVTIELSKIHAVNSLSESQCKVIMTDNKEHRIDKPHGEVVKDWTDDAAIM